MPELTNEEFQRQHDEYRESYAMKANILWEIFRSIKVEHPMLHSIPGSIRGLPTVRITPSALGLDAPRDIKIMINENGDLIAFFSCVSGPEFTIDMSDPKSFEKIKTWIIKAIK
jgi:hypothetical protein